MAIVIPHEVHLRNTLAAKGLDSTSSLHDLCLNPAVQELVLKDANAVGRKNGLKPAELLQAVVLTPDEWTPESGLVTATQKLQRAKIAKTFKEQIDVCVLLFLLVFLCMLLISYPFSYAQAVYKHDQ
jgi:long-chain acyl-CoA synthetase